MSTHHVQIHWPLEQQNLPHLKFNSINVFLLFLLLESPAVYYGDYLITLFQLHKSHRLPSNKPLMILPKGVYGLDVKAFNMLPSYIKTDSDNPKKFKLILQKFLYKNFFYSLDKNFLQNN